MQDSKLNASSPLVSIIIPVYQVEEYIEECVVSVVNQTYKNLEIIIVDDCGTDNSIFIAKKILSEQEIPWKLLKHEKNRGLSAARNTGVDNSTGEYFFFLDSDDYLADDCIEKLVTFALKNNTDMLFGNILYQRDNEIYAGYYTRTNSIRESSSSLDAYISGKAFPMACNRLIRKKNYIKSGVSFIEGIIHEDEPWSFSLALKIEQAWYTNNAIYYYRQRKGSITQNQEITFQRALSHYACLEVFSSASSLLSKHVEFQNFYAHRYMALLYNLDSNGLSWKEKQVICKQLLNLPNLPKKNLNQFFIYRVIRLMSFFVPLPLSVIIVKNIIKLYHLCRKIVFSTNRHLFF